MKKEELEKYISDGCTIKQISENLNCSMTNVRYYLKKYKLSTKNVKKYGNGKCKVCQNSLKGKQTHFCSKKCKNDDYTSNNNNYPKQKERSLERKIKLIEMLGGRCKMCGYKKNLSALCFHHKNPEEKIFGIDSRRCANTNWNYLVEEAKKCDLLCANCHMEIHNKHFNDLI